MYNQTYDDYMRNVLGYPNFDGYRNIGMNPMNTMGVNSMNTMVNMNTQDMYCDDIEQLYPETYRIVYPMVCMSCDRIQFSTMPVTDEMITRMTDDIYDQVESDGRININVNITTDVREKSSTSDPRSETRQRRPRNPFLQDFIRVLLLRELLRRRRFPMRPF